MTNKKMQEKADLLRRLRENGVALSGDSIQQKEVLLMRQIGGPGESRAFDQGTGGTGYILTCNILVLSDNLAIKGIFLEPVYGGQSITLLTDPVERAAGFSGYRFCGRNGKILSEIDRAEVLNHRLIRPSGLLSRGAPLQGFLLWFGMEEMPDAFKHGGELPATVTFVDQFDTLYPFQVNLKIDRRNKWSPAKRTENSRGSLFSKKDPVPM
jgi:hypothetical protein